MANVIFDDSTLDRMVFAVEQVRLRLKRATSALQAAEITETETTETQASGKFSVVSLDALVRMKLTSYCDKDRTHLRDMIEVGLIDDSWPMRFPTELGKRLQQLLDDANG